VRGRRKRCPRAIPDSGEGICGGPRAFCPPCRRFRRAPAKGGRYPSDPYKTSILVTAMTGGPTIHGCSRAALADGAVTTNIAGSRSGPAGGRHWGRRSKDTALAARLELPKRYLCVGAVTPDGGGRLLSFLQVWRRLGRLPHEMCEKHILWPGSDRPAARLRGARTVSRRISAGITERRRLVSISTKHDRCIGAGGLRSVHAVGGEMAVLAGLTGGTRAL